MLLLIWQIIKKFSKFHLQETLSVYLSLLGNLSLWSVISNESSLFLGMAKSDAMNQEGILRIMPQYKLIKFI